MTAPKQRDQTAQEAAEAYAAKLFPCTKPCDSYGICEGCSERLIFDSGRAFGRREGLEEAAEICEKDNPLVFGHRIAQAIRAASEGK